MFNHGTKNITKSLGVPEDFKANVVIVDRVKRILEKGSVEFTWDEKIATVMVAMSMMNTSEFFEKSNKFKKISRLMEWVLKGMDDETMNELFLIASEPISNELWKRLEEAGLVDEDGNIIAEP
jgi:hypothetical protein